MSAHDVALSSWMRMWMWIIYRCMDKDSKPDGQPLQQPLAAVCSILELINMSVPSVHDTSLQRCLKMFCILKRPCKLNYMLVYISSKICFNSFVVSVLRFSGWVFADETQHENVKFIARRKLLNIAPVLSDGEEIHWVRIPHLDWYSICLSFKTACMLMHEAIYNRRLIWSIAFTISSFLSLFLICIHSPTLPCGEPFRMVADLVSCILFILHNIILMHRDFKAIYF